MPQQFVEDRLKKMEINFIKHPKDEKPMEQIEETEGINTCRICISSNPIFLVSLWVKHSIEANLAGMVTYVTGLEIHEDDPLPQYLCNECLSKLEEASKIKRKSIESDQKMRQQYFESFPMKEDFGDNSNDNEDFVEINNDSEPADFLDTYNEFLKTSKSRKSEASEKATAKGKCRTCHRKMRQNHVCVQQTCYFCFLDFWTKKSLFEHLEQKHKINGEYSCPMEECKDRKVITPTSIHNHLKSHYSPILISCDICQKTFISQKTFKNHQKLHSDKERYCCDLCGLEFVEKQRLLRHIRVIHLFQKNHLCDICSISFKELYLLRSHQIREHGAEGKFRCSICSQSFAIKYRLARHMESAHRTKASFDCELCDNQFQNRMGLQRHVELVHNREETQYQCQYCFKNFYKKYNLTCHLRIHLDEKKHECHFKGCSARFVKKSSLDVHLRKHTGERPYTCTVCNLVSYKDRSSLAKHLQRSHHIEKPTIRKSQTVSK